MAHDYGRYNWDEGDVVILDDEGQPTEADAEADADEAKGRSPGRPDPGPHEKTTIP